MNLRRSPGRAAGRPKRDGKLGRSILLAVIAGLAINVALSFLTDFGELASILARAGIGHVIVPFLCIAAVYLVDSIRYILVFRPFGIRLSFFDALYNNVIGYFFSGITPSSAGGQPFQVHHFSRLGLDSTVSANVVFSRLMVMNIVQVLVVGTFARRGIALMHRSGNAAYVLYAGLAMTATATMMLAFAMLNPHLIGVLGLRLDGSRFGRRIGTLVKDPVWAEKLSSWTISLRDGFRFMWAKMTGLMAIDILLFLVDQLVWAVGLYAPLTWLTPAAPAFPEFLFAFILCNLISSFIPTPGASGSVEGTYVLVLGALTGEPGAVLSAVILWRFGSYYLHLGLGALVYFTVSIPDGVYRAAADGTVRRAPSIP